jgi:hypothetical protein
MLATVGQTRITGDDISYRITVERAYGNDSVIDSVALVALINDALEREVARRWKVDVTPHEIAALSRHVDQTTRAPEILAKVRHAFGDDRAAYERLYLAPRIVNRKLRALLSRNVEILDPGFRNSILSANPNVWWVARWLAQPKMGVER